MYKLETKVVYDIAGRFIVPAYQRGYRWGTDEVRRLLDDVVVLKGRNGQANKNYCLQPIVVKKLSDGTFELIDGQQRLTTLFLLHWYAAKKEHVPPEEFAFLKNFSYETRPDSREFCEFLIDCDIAFDEKFRGAENLWGKLKAGAISFYFLSIKDMGLTDELYITMNSRGKLLTDFEHFKAEFKRRLDDLGRDLSDDIILKIDTDWTDLLWAYRDKGVNVDDGFLAYFAFLCDVIFYRNGGTPQGRSRDAFTLLDEIFDGDALANIEFIKNSFNQWCALAKSEKISDFFADRVSKGSRVDATVNQHAPGKIITYFDDTDFFGAYVKSYKNFSLGQVVMLYAFQTYLLNDEKISDADFRRRIRIVNNLVTNSGDAELSNSTKRNNGNRIPAMLKQVDKYDAFRPPRYGRYWWENFKDAPYCFVTLHEQQKRSTNSYQPFLKTVGVGNILGDYFGERLDLGDYYVTCENDSYVVWDADTDAPQHRLTITQRNGVDTEDRIKKFKDWAQGYFY